MGNVPFFKTRTYSQIQEWYAENNIENSRIITAVVITRKDRLILEEHQLLSKIQENTEALEDKRIKVTNFILEQKIIYLLKMF